MYGTDFIMDKLGELKIKISPLSFYQVNPIQMKKLYDTAIDFAKLTGNEKYIYGNQRTPFEKREKKHSKPPITHPWRLSNYDSFQEAYNPHKKAPY